jgi:hypothetical protein
MEEWICQRTLPILIEYLIKDRQKGPVRYPEKPTKKPKWVQFFGPTNGWACLGIAKLKQIVNKKPKRNLETMTCFPSIPPSGTRSRPWTVQKRFFLLLTSGTQPDFFSVFTSITPSSYLKTKIATSTGLEPQKPRINWVALSLTLYYSPR